MPVWAAAQEPLTVDAAVQASIAHNASLRAARAAVDEAAARVTEARSGFYPRFSLSESWQRGDQPVFVFGSLLSSRTFAASNFAIDALNHPDAIGYFHASVGVEQVIYDGGRQRSAADAAGLGRDMATASADQAAAGIAVQTTQTFGRLIASEAAKRAADAGVDSARQDLTRAEHRRDVGMATDADVLALVVHVADLQQRAIQASSEAAVARAELNRLMGAPVNAPIVAAMPTAAALPSSPDVTALLVEADAARPEVKRARAAATLAEKNQSQATAALVPQVAAQAAYDWSGTRFGDRAGSWLVGGQIRWTLSTGGAEIATRKAAAASVTRAAAEAEDVRAAVHVEVVTAAGRVESARAREAVGRAAVDQARESQRIIRDRFEQGLAGVTDVLRASTAVLDAESNRTAAVVDVIVSDAMLRRAVGRVTR
ncbi:MAG TPA: TolC family protein [Vicinamibacterales bacterium]|nr:TolC family protein [Vicinamibacterales bacterium]